ncbi:hypothetical protein PR202_ga09558 [Eleusine coracana subsp. coracana]|uniref:Uncharacterized protein n=1 Tax=Eleusine coracana subsp. coracana TaxID=191504 RepID=A0AAV5C4W3_ELECO|nr:hypothetical protein PR202_ga09558 [Eleusine coracana subsp. coracana]
MATGGLAVPGTRAELCLVAARIRKLRTELGFEWRTAEAFERLTAAEEEELAVGGGGGGVEELDEDRRMPHVVWLRRRRISPSVDGETAEE